MLLFSLSAWGAPASVVLPHCGSPLPPRFDASLPIPARAPRAQGGAPDPVLAVRDAYGDFAMHETPHFAIKWGPALDPDPDALAGMAADLEAIWQRQVVELGWPAPPGSDQYKLNVYLANPPGVPDIPFPGGFVDVDPENQPFLGLSIEALQSYEGAGDGWAAWVMAHELNHALQLDSNAFLDGRYGPWFWEATANWVVPETWGGGAEPEWGLFLLNPHIGVDMWSLDWDDPVREARQYDSAMFLHWLTVQQGLGHDLIRDVWVDGTPGDEPLDLLDTRVPGGIRAAFSEFAATFAVNDHDLVEVYEDGIAQLGQSEPDNRIAAVVAPGGTPVPERPPRALRPEGFGWSHVVWESTGDHLMVVDVAPNPTGSRDTPTVMDGYVIRERDEAFRRFAPGEAVQTADGDVLHLVVVAVPERLLANEVFGYEYTFVDVSASPEPDPIPEEAGGCGCAAPPGGRGAAWMGLLALATGTASRRRRPARP